MKLLRNLKAWWKRWWDDLRYYPSYQPTFFTIERYAPGSGSCLTKRPEICITPEDYQRLFTYIKNCPQEISGLGCVRLDPMNDHLILSDIMLFKQKVSGADTDLDQEAIGKLVTEMVMRDADPSTLKLWWHSHNSGSVFWSQHQDEKTIENLKRFGIEYLISIVGNHAGDYICRLDIFKPVHVTIDNIPIRILETENASLKAQILGEIQEKVEGYDPRKKASREFTICG